MEIGEAAHDRKIKTLGALEVERQWWWPHWRTIADYFMPRRYIWLLSPTERMAKLTRNALILDATGTTAGKTTAAGMMNGITSPSRPWLRLRVVGAADEDYAANVWTDEVTRIILLTMAETNFYNAMAVVYLDLVFFGTASCLIYEDYENVFRCYNNALGEYYLGQDDRLLVNKYAREFVMTVDQVVRWFKIENVSDALKLRYENGGAQRETPVSIAHLIEPNDDGADKVKGGWSHREYYWEIGAPKGRILKKAAYNELPGIFPRWEVVGNDSYGSSPAMDALGDVIQLQHETKKKGQALDKTVDPPVLADIQLQHKPLALLPRGITYVAGVNNVGVKAAYQIQMPFDQLSADINDVRQRIQEIFYNDLFKMISQLDTVRSATEIDARREEKLVLLGPVLERFENEALDPAIRRIYSILERAELLPEPPPSIAGRDIEIQYISVLTSAQTAVATIPTERFLGLVGNIAPVHPDALFIPNWDEILRDYGKDVGVRTKNINTPEVTDQLRQAQQKQSEALQATQTAESVTKSAKALSETDVGGGANALSKLINPYNGG